MEIPFAGECRADARHALMCGDGWANIGHRRGMFGSSLVNSQQPVDNDGCSCSYRKPVVFQSNRSVGAGNQRLGPVRSALKQYHHASWVESRPPGLDEWPPLLEEGWEGGVPPCLTPGLGRAG